MDDAGFAVASARFGDHAGIDNSGPVFSGRPMPGTMRDLFTLLAELRSGQTLAGLIGEMDVSASEVAAFSPLLGCEAPLAGRLDSPRAALHRALLSPAFREKAVPAFLAAFPELKREIFVHVPKCAGTDLTLALSPLMPALAIDQAGSDEQFIAGLASAASAASGRDRVFVHGHLVLGEFLVGRTRRPADRVFSILRDPVALMVSQANYKIGRLCNDPRGCDGDTAETLAHLGLRVLPEGLTDRDLRDLVIRVLLDPGAAPPNLACWHLGFGLGSTVDDALGLIATHDVELTTTAFYEPWLRRRWGIPVSARHNRSVPLLTGHEARRLFGAYLAEATAEDQILFDLVTSSIETAGGESITGRRLPRLAGSTPLPVFAREISARARDLAAMAPCKPFVVEQPPFVDLYLTPPMVPVEGEVRVETLLDVTFGTGGSGNDCLRSGWSGLEDGFVWSDGVISGLRLPASPNMGCVALRLVGSPFVASEDLPPRDIVLSVNGWPMGVVAPADLSVIEIEIGAEQAGLALDVTIAVPDARPVRAVNGMDDQRRLGFCLRRVQVVRYARV